METGDPDWPDVAALQDGDESALDRLITRHRGPILGFVKGMIGNTEDAEEIAQETFVRAYFSINGFRPNALFVSWLFQIARNLCRDYFRSRAYKQRLASDGLETLSFDPSPAAGISSTEEERVEVVQAALMKLPPKLRECLILTAIEGFTHAEAGARLGLTAKAVEVRNYRARLLLSKLLKDF